MEVCLVGQQLVPLVGERLLLLVEGCLGLLDLLLDLLEVGDEEEVGLLE